MLDNLIRSIPLVRTCLPILAFVPFLLFSCARAPDIREAIPPHIIKNVPFYPQEKYQCGPAALAGVLNYWQAGVSPADIAAEVYSESARGTLDIDMILCAQRKGLHATQYTGNLNDIRHNIDLGYPMIVLVDYGFWLYQQNHFMVVVGYNKKGILANSGTEHRRFIPFKGFLKSWRKTACWTMLVTPKY